MAPIVVTLIAAGETGAGVAGAVVVMAAGVLARFDWVKLKGPPALPVVTFCSFTVGVLRLVNEQEKSAPATTLAAGILSVLPDNVPIAPVLPVTALLASAHDALTS